MKSYLILILTCMCACVSAPAPIARTYVMEPPPTDFELTVQDRKSPERAEHHNDEGLTYRTSLRNIQLTITHEINEYYQCLKDHNVNSICQDMLKDFCKVDELIDSRGRVHKKPYCK